MSRGLSVYGGLVRRTLAVACLTATTFAASAVASPSQVALDRQHGVRFTMTGPVLTVRLVPHENRDPPDVRRKVWGKRIDAICSPTFNPRGAVRRAVHAVRLWPRGQMEVSYRFRRDISDQVRWCLLEDGGVDVAAVGFRVFIRLYGDNADDRRIGQELRRYLLHTAGSQPWLRRVKAIVVDRGVIAIVTDLRRTRRGKRIARQLCGLIQGADVADFTSGHRIFGPEEVVLRVCPARRQ
jgi:hypothetical protein